MTQTSTSPKLGDVVRIRRSGKSRCEVVTINLFPIDGMASGNLHYKGTLDPADRYFGSFRGYVAFRLADVQEVLS